MLSLIREQSRVWRRKVASILVVFFYCTQYCCILLKGSLVVWVVYVGSIHNVRLLLGKKVKVILFFSSHSILFLPHSVHILFSFHKRKSTVLLWFETEPNDRFLFNKLIAVVIVKLGSSKKEIAGRKQHNNPKATGIWLGQTHMWRSQMLDQLIQAHGSIHVGMSLQTKISLDPSTWIQRPQESVIFFPLSN